MDIQQWLANTADREPPDQHHHPAIPDFLQPHHDPEQAARKYRRKRKRASSDSSILDLPHHHHYAAVANHVQASDGDGLRAPGHAVARSRNWQSSQYAEPNPDHPPGKTYEKRARHKTRPDRYDAKPSKHNKQRDDRNARPKRRKSHRSGDGGRTTGLVQSFQLKNGPKNHRLTLKPDTTAGLFKHGRASAQIDGRGAGLPDLVFNEMRFLQRPRDHQDEAPNGPGGQRTTKDVQRVRDEEVSAYFAADQRAAQPEGEDDRHHASRLESRHTRSTERRRATKSAVELPEKPYLGFGSKGNQVDSKDNVPTSNSYYTWSDSAPRHADPPSTRRQAVHASADGAVPRKRRQASPAGSHAPAQEKIDHRMSERKSKRPESPVAGGTWIQSRRARGPQLVEVYQPTTERREANEKNRRSVTKTTLQSLPRRTPPEHTSNPKKSNVNGAPALRSSSYHTSDILNVRHLPAEHTHDDGGRRSDQDTFERQLDNRENEDPRSSTPTSKLLRQAHRAIARPQMEEPQRIVQNPPVSRRRADVDVGEEVCSVGIPDNVFPERHMRHGSRHSSSHQGLPERRLQSAKGFVAAQTPRLARPAGAPRLSGTAHAHRRPIFVQEEEMLDHYPDAPLLCPESFVYTNEGQAEDLVHDTTSDRAVAFFEAQADLQPFSEFVPQHLSSTALTAVRPSSIHGVSIPEDSEGERCAVPADQQMDIGASGELAGFWKPHRLY